MHEKDDMATTKKEELPLLRRLMRGKFYPSTL